MSAATISTKGQLVIPLRFRKALHLQAGEKVSFSLQLKSHRFLTDAVSTDSLPTLANGKEVMDAPLARLAASQGLKLATLDGILRKKPWAAGIAENPL